MATSTRQTKRRFQPSITSYFGRSDRDTSPPSSAASHPSPLSPPLPAAVQSSLLNVGMRVRKSVPEGYKTETCHASKRTGEVHGSSDAFFTVGGLSTHRGGFTELTPYCGILRIGGYGSQALTSNTGAFGPLRIGNDEYDFCSSQESSTSTSSTDGVSCGPLQTLSLSKKRRFQDEDIFAPVAVWEDEDMVPASARFMAVPKSRRKWPVTTPRKIGVGEGQENITNDFEEAAFLRAPDWLEEDMEMDGL